MTINSPYDPCKPIERIARCWEATTEWLDFIKGLIEQVFKDDPSLIPIPPAVTDGTPAEPGTVGELVYQHFEGTFTDVPTSGTAFPALFFTSLTPGDWEISYFLDRKSVV